jgi:hypothetical protein
VAKKNWKAIYKKYHSSKEEIRKRSNRNKARRKLGLKNGDPRHADHRDGNPNNNKSSNLRAIGGQANLKRPRGKYRKLH